MKISENLSIEQQMIGLPILLKVSHGLTYTPIFITLNLDEASLLARVLESYIQDSYVADMREILGKRYNADL